MTKNKFTPSRRMLTYFGNFNTMKIHLNTKWQLKTKKITIINWIIIFIIANLLFYTSERSSHKTKFYIITLSIILLLLLLAILLQFCYKWQL